MNTEIVTTSDGSNTIKNEYFGETYHSINGAIAESTHIFINLGLKKIPNKKINILEIGYGTGLNAILTFIENKTLNNEIFYHGIEKYPITEEIFKKLEYNSIFKIEEKTYLDFTKNWNRPIKISKNFTLLKDNCDFVKFSPSSNYDIIYFDAFSPDTQPEMWDYENLKKIIDKLNNNGIFVTYCSKGIVKQALRNLGLIVKRVAGPIGKRHVIYALKN